MVNSIFSRLAGKKVLSGETVTVKPDRILLNDVISVGAFEDVETVTEREKVVVVVDHGLPIPAGKVPGSDVDLNIHERALVKFAEKFQLRFEFGTSIGYQLIAQELHEGEFVIGLGRNIGTMGIHGALGIPVLPSEMKKLIKTGEIEITVPKVYRIKLTGEIEAPGTARDAGYMMVTSLNREDIKGKVLELSFENIKNLRDADKFQILNLAADLGAISAIVTPFNGEYDAEFNLGSVVPVVVASGNITNVIPVSKIVEPVEITTGFIGGCGGGYIEELRKAAEIFKGKKVAYGTRIVVAPVDKATYLQALNEGLMNIFLDAGAYFMHPGCLACNGIGAGTLSKGEIAFGTGSFNSIGCLGASDSKVYLASAETVAKGAILGIISKELEG